jgi:hypothetical protein
MLRPLVAALELGNSYIGIEAGEHYATVAGRPASTRRC